MGGCDFQRTRERGTFGNDNRHISYDDWLASMSPSGDREASRAREIKPGEITFVFGLPEAA